MLNETVGAILQLLIFTLIPFLVYAIRNKTTKGFFDYIGLKKSTKKANYLAMLACLLIVVPMLFLTLVSADFKAIMLDPSSVTGKFREMGFGGNAMFILIVIAVFKTALAEEIFFRGFLIFGGMHAAIFAVATNNVLFLTVIFLMPSIGAYVSTYLNEKVGNGSIIPGWISHALANVISYGVVGFII